jgi:hypothetical protein
MLRHALEKPMNGFTVATMNFGRKYLYELKKL